jgi:hypothetical protein
MVVLRSEPLNWPDDAPAVVEFLVANVRQNLSATGG